MALLVRLAAMTGAVVIPVYGERLGDAARFKTWFLPEVEMMGTGDTAADFRANLARLNGVVEPIVRAHLDQWFYVLELDFAH